jgi:hypothetical protein
MGSNRITVAPKHFQGRPREGPKVRCETDNDRTNLRKTLPIDRFCRVLEILRLKKFMNALFLQNQLFFGIFPAGIQVFRLFDVLSAQIP